MTTETNIFGAKTRLLKEMDRIRADFPILSRQVNGAPLVYLDNAATAQTPTQVIEAINHYYKFLNANIHRGVHGLAQEATDAWEGARVKLQKHFGARYAHEIIFTSGTTHAINLVASGFKSLLKASDEILVSAVEHHSNIVPLQMLAESTGAFLKVIPAKDNGALDLETYKKILSKKTKLVAFNHISNALGTVNPVKEITGLAHDIGAAVLVDGAQACPHLAPDMLDLDVDFYTGSGHKMYGPTGIGFLYGKENWLEKLPPYQGGGEMIKEVTFKKTTYAGLPHKFEAGTPNICGGIAFGAAVDYLNSIGFDKIQEHEEYLLHLATEKLEAVEGLKIYGTDQPKAAVISFGVAGIHPYDIGVILDKMGIAVRTGHHCAQPIMDRFGIRGTVRASFALYNTPDEIDRLVNGLTKALKMLR